MARRRSLLRLGLAVPVVLSLTASLGFLPASASATPRIPSAARAEDAHTLAYVVNTRTDRRTIAEVQRAITAAGGTIVVTYDGIGVIVVHSANPDFGRRLRAVRGVESAGATRTAPLSAAGRPTRVRCGTSPRPKPRGSGKPPAAAPNHSKPSSGTCGRSARTRPRRSTPAAGTSRSP